MTALIPMGTTVTDGIHTGILVTVSRTHYGLQAGPSTDVFFALHADVAVVK